MHCTVEVDSFGQFSTKAKTKVASLPSAVWNEVRHFNISSVIDITGVNQGEWARDSPEFGVDTLTQIAAPPNFVIFHNFEHQKTPFQEIFFWGGGALSPDPSPAEGYPPLHTSPSPTIKPSGSALGSPIIPARFAPV